MNTRSSSALRSEETQPSKPEPDDGDMTSRFFSSRAGGVPLIRVAPVSLSPFGPSFCVLRPGLIMVLQVSRARASPSLSSKLEALSCSPLPRSPPPLQAEAAAVAAVLTPAPAFLPASGSSGSCRPAQAQVTALYLRRRWQGDGSTSRGGNRQSRAS